MLLLSKYYSGHTAGSLLHLRRIVSKSLPCVTYGVTNRGDTGGAPPASLVIFSLYLLRKVMQGTCTLMAAKNTFLSLLCSVLISSILYTPSLRCLNGFLFTGHGLFEISIFQVHNMEHICMGQQGLVQEICLVGGGQILK